MPNTGVVQYTQKDFHSPATIADAKVLAEFILLPLNGDSKVIKIYCIMASTKPAEIINIPRPHASSKYFLSSTFQFLLTATSFYQEFNFAIKWSPTRNALAMIVKDGFTAPIEGKKLPSTT